MIRIARPKRIPSVLRKAGASARKAHEDDFDARAADYRSGQRTFEFQRAVFAHKAVKSALLRMQHDKCAFCEARPLHVSDGDVEHFRPKGATRATRREALVRPGYYWLAYEWDNLLFACERCNRRHKRSEFPLARPAARAADHHGDTTRESPLFINPAGEDPAAHIAFRAHVPIAPGGNRRGATTIDALGLRRPALNRAREEHLEKLRVIFELSNLPSVPADKRQKAERLLDRMIAPQAEYALMSATAVAAWRRGEP